MSMTKTEMIAVIQAAENGARIEQFDRDNPGVGWRECWPAWNFWRFDYRVKTIQPSKPREWWINIYPDCPATLFKSKDEADVFCSVRTECVHVGELPKDDCDKPKLKPTEWWVNVYRDGSGTCFTSKEHADRFDAAKTRVACVRSRQLLEGEQ